MFRWLNLLLLLLLCCVNHSGTGTKSVTGIKGGNVTLSCDFKPKEILQIDLSLHLENISVCQKTSSEECGRVFYEESCDVIIKNVSFSDAGKYFRRVYYRNDQGRWKRQEKTYQLHIRDEFSVKTGAELNFTSLLSNAEKWEKNSSGGWKEVWNRNDRKNFIIKEFTSTHTGTYRVLDSEENILITVTVTESSTQSKGNLEKDDDKLKSNDWNLKVGVSLGILAVIVIVIVILAVIVIVIVIVKCRQRRNREYREAQQEEQAHPEVLGNL